MLKQHSQRYEIIANFMRNKMRYSMNFDKMEKMMTILKEDDIKHRWSSKVFMTTLLQKMC